MVTLAETLIGKGFDVRIYDPDVRFGNLVGTNRAYIEHAIPHIAGLMCDSETELLAHARVLVIGKAVPGLASWQIDDSVMTLDVARTMARPALLSNPIS